MGAPQVRRIPSDVDLVEQLHRLNREKVDLAGDLWSAHRQLEKLEPELDDALRTIAEIRTAIELPAGADLVEAVIALEKRASSLEAALTYLKAQVREGQARHR